MCDGNSQKASVYQDNRMFTSTKEANIVKNDLYFFLVQSLVQVHPPIRIQ